MSIEWAEHSKITSSQKELVMSNIRQIVLVSIWDQTCNPLQPSLKFAEEASEKIRELLETEGLI